MFALFCGSPAGARSLPRGRAAAWCLRKRGAAARGRAAASRNTARMTLGGGFFGVGSMEVAVILAVGWLVLGPKELIKLTREIGKALGSLRGVAVNARDSLTSMIESDSLSTEFNKFVQNVTDPLAPPDVKAKASAPETVADLNASRQSAESSASSKAADANAPEKVVPAQKSNSSAAASPDFATAITSVAQTEDIARKDAARSRFEEQMRRMNDPDQVSPFEASAKGANNGVAGAESGTASLGAPNDAYFDESLELRPDLDLSELERRYAIRRARILGMDEPVTSEPDHSEADRSSLVPQHSTKSKSTASASSDERTTPTSSEVTSSPPSASPRHVGTDREPSSATGSTS